MTKYIKVPVEWVERMGKYIDDIPAPRNYETVLLLAYLESLDNMPVEEEK